MKDTYDEYWDNGPIRYIGKCSDFKVESGWHKLKLTWKNSIDATTDKIKIVWTSSDEKDSVTIDAKKESYITKAVFKDASYVFNIYAMNKDGVQSIKTTAYARPFTETHELIRSFGNLEDRYAYVKNNLLLILSLYHESVINASIHYVKGNGELVDWVLTKEDFDKKYFVLKDIDVSKAVTVNRTVKLEESFEEINMETYELVHNDVFINPDFALQVNDYYALPEMSSDFINSVEEIHLNYSINSMEDLLYFPNLKKVVLGGERYMTASHKNDDASIFNFGSEASVFALRVLHELLGVEVEIYNNQYDILSSLDFAKDMGNPTLPELEYLNTSTWSITCSTTEDGDNSHPEYLLDDDMNTSWRPLTEQNKIREHIMTIDMKSEKSIKGIKIVQPNSDDIDPVYFPDVFKIEISGDGTNWESALPRTQRIIGKGRGESTIINFAKSISTRYVRFKINDKISNRKCTYLADFMIF